MFLLCVSALYQEGVRARGHLYEALLCVSVMCFCYVFLLCVSAMCFCSVPGRCARGHLYSNDIYPVPLCLV